MFGKRPDGRVIKNIQPMMKIVPYLMKTRTDSMNMYEDVIPCEPMDAYIAAKKAQGIEMSYMTIMIAALVRLMALRPQLNRFVMNGKVYTRPKIWISFVVHTTLKEDSEETTIKLCFEGTETILEIAQMINERIAKETGTKRTDNGTDKLVNFILSLGPITKLLVNTLLFMDRHNIMPKAVIELSPFHTSGFITNLKSLGINHIFHHVYEFGTTGIFLAMGKEKKVPVVQGNGFAIQKQLGWGLVSDERFCDGLYFARSLKKFKRFLADPAQLEVPLDKKVEDVD